MMRHASVWLLCPVLALSSLVVACGDDDDSGNTPTAGTGGKSSGGSGGSNSGGSSSATGGKSSSSTGGSASNGTGGKSSGAGNVGNTNLSDIDTPDEAEAACEHLASKLSQDDLDAFLVGACAFTGLLAELSGGNCEEAKAQCIAEDEGDMTVACDGDDIPDCDNVTVEEYATCSAAQIKAGADAFSVITCETDLASLPTEAPPPPAECVGVYEKCPELAPSAD